MVVSQHAWAKGGAGSGGSTMFLKPGERVKVEDLIHGVIVQSGNDASIVLAEGLAGTEEAFAEQMTRKGREIGLLKSTFRNSSGLPDPEHMVTARDLATLARRTIEDFPDLYTYYAHREFTHNGIRQGNRNPLLYKSMGVDGLKTGHTQVSGYGLTASAQRGERRIVLVLNGLPSMQLRSDESERLIEYAFREFENYKLFKAGEEVARADVWYGEADQVPIVGASDLVVTLPRKARSQMKAMVSFDAPIPAPIRRGDRVATLTVTVPDSPSLSLPLVAGADVEERGLLGRLTFALRHLVGTVLD
jgi:D-alanyl-D-alanine carboxypeptidase (penicillin-binding protein 5/6)